MMKASPGAMSAPNAAMMAAAQAGKAPMCSGNTTCCATTSPRAFINAQEASCDSRMMVEKPVRNSEFCISCTMPERLALTTSSSIASTAMMSLCIRHEQVLPCVHASDLAGADQRRAIELIEDRRSRKLGAHVEPLALIDGAVELLSVEAHAPLLAQGILNGCTDRLEAWHCDRRHKPDPSRPIGHD